MTLVAFPFDQLWCVAANCLHQMYFHLISNTLPGSSELPVLDILGHLLFVSHECHMSITHPVGMNLGGKTVAAEECSAVKWTHWPVLKQSQTVKMMSFLWSFLILIISVGACVFLQFVNWWVFRGRIIHSKLEVMSFYCNWNIFIRKYILLSLPFSYP